MSANCLPDFLQYTLDYLQNTKDLKSWSTYEENGLVTLTLKWKPKSDSFDQEDSASTPMFANASYKRKSLNQVNRDFNRRNSWLQQKQASENNISQNVQERTSISVTENSVKVDSQTVNMTERDNCSIAANISPAQSCLSEYEHDTNVNNDQLVTATPCTPPMPKPSESADVAIDQDVKDHLTVSCTVCYKNIVAGQPIRHCTKCWRNKVKVDMCTWCSATGHRHNQHKCFITEGTLSPEFNSYEEFSDNG